MRQNSKKYLFVLFMCFSTIFWFSSQDGVQSHLLSQKVQNYVARFGLYDVMILGDFFRKINIRKVAHFILYAMVGNTTYRYFKSKNNDPSQSIVKTVLVCLAFAVFDEFHQSFVPGRTPYLKDVVIDLLGSVFGSYIEIKRQD